VKPAKAEVPPITAGMSIALDVWKLAPVFESVIVHVRLAPSYAR
jgi:hypothetical protein